MRVLICILVFSLQESQQSKFFGRRGSFYDSPTYPSFHGSDYGYNFPSYGNPSFYGSNHGYGCSPKTVTVTDVRTVTEFDTIVKVVPRTITKETTEVVTDFKTVTETVENTVTEEKVVVETQIQTKVETQVDTQYITETEKVYVTETEKAVVTKTITNEKEVLVTKLVPCPKAVGMGDDGGSSKEPLGPVEVPKSLEALSKDSDADESIIDVIGVKKVKPSVNLRRIKGIRHFNNYIPPNHNNF